MKVVNFFLIVSLIKNDNRAGDSCFVCIIIIIISTQLNDFVLNCGTRGSC